MLSEEEKRIEERWEQGIPHKREALMIAKALEKYLPHWDIKFGGDGDSGEDIAYALSLWIEDGKPDLIPDWYNDVELEA